MTTESDTDCLIIGSGFGGAFAALALARAGTDVLIVERGIWPERDDSCWDERKLYFPTPRYRGYAPILVNQRRDILEEIWPEDMVGGMSTVYGAAAFRMREEDFLGTPREDGSGRVGENAWPIGYSDMEPYYHEAERVQNVAGVEGEDLTEPPRTGPFPQKPPDLPRLSRRIWKAAAEGGLHPAHIPLAINFDGKSPGGTCIRCDTCDKFLCKIGAKNDVTVVCLPAAMHRGARVLPDTRVVRINVSRGRAESVEAVHQCSGERLVIRARQIILAGGALGSPHLLLASGIRSSGPGGSLLGRGLMRHVNSVVTGLSPTPVNPDRSHHKSVWIPDFYHGNPQNGKKPAGPWGTIQQLHIPGRMTLRANSPRGLKTAAAVASRFLMGLLTIAEDVRSETNRVFLDPTRTDRFDMPILRIFHRYGTRDRAVRRALEREARTILQRARAVPVYSYPVVSFSHAYGTCRFGGSEAMSVLDPMCKVWGMKNLFVVDASFMPSGGSVNPSLTIAANALRVVDGILNS